MYPKAAGSTSIGSMETLDKVEVLQIDQPQLISPNEVVVNDAVFVQAEPPLSPYGTNS